MSVKVHIKILFKITWIADAGDTFIDKIIYVSVDNESDIFNWLKLNKKEIGTDFKISCIGTTEQFNIMDYGKV